MDDLRETNAPVDSSEKSEDVQTSPVSRKELFYDDLIEKFHITKRGMDIVLIVLAVAFVFFIVLGALKGNHMI